jgi:ferredoxin
MSLLLDWLESLAIETKITKSCSRLKSPKSSCTICLEQCDRDAVSFRKNKAEIDHALCNGCGRCVIACPTSSILGSPPARSFENKRLVYDSDSPAPTTKELLIYFAHGVDGLTVYEDVIHADWQKAIAETNETLLAMNQPLFTIEKKKQNLTRRDLLFSASKKGKQLAKKLAPAAWRINTNGWRLGFYFPDKQFYEVEINHSTCNLCQACFSLCPEKVFRTDRDSELALNHQSCTNCSLCIDICPEKAIVVKQKLQDKTETHLSFIKKQCPTCQQHFLTFSKSETCHICSRRNTSWL